MSDSPSPRAVFDTNILFSAIGWSGAPYECLEAAMGGRVKLIICTEIIAELHETLIGKLRMSRSEADRAVSEILLAAHLIELQAIPAVVADDPDDDAVVAYAVEGEATFLVSGDQHLLRLGKYEGIRIVTARDFLDHLTSAER